MKRILFIISVLFLASCVKEQKALQESGNVVTFNIQVAPPTQDDDTKVTFSDDNYTTGTTLEWTGNETMMLIFGNSSADNKNNPVIKSVDKGVFKGTVTIPEGFTIADLRGLVVPGENSAYYRSSPRISMYVPYWQTVTDVNTPNWEYVPFFYDLTDGGMELLEDGSYGFPEPVTLKSAGSLVRFNVYGRHPEQEADEVLKSVRISAVKTSSITKKNISGWTEHELGKDNNASSNYGHSFVRVDIDKPYTIADKSADNGVKVFAALVLGGKRMINEVRVETDKAVYTKTFTTLKSFSKTYYDKFVALSVGLDLSQFDAERIDKSSTQYKIEEIIRISGIPSLQVTYSQGDKTESYIAVNDDYYGLYNVKQESHTLTTESIYQAASISKPPLAYIALKMREEGKLDFDKPLYKYYGTYSETDDLTDDEEDASNEFLAMFADDAAKEKAKLITALMVMHHTTGLDNSNSTSGITFRSEPGEKYYYSGTAIHLLDLALGKILGKTLTEYARDYIFSKIEMTHSSYAYETEHEATHAYGHRASSTGNGDYQYNNLKGPNAAYSMRTNADEYTKFLRWVLKGCDLNEESKELYLKKYFNMNYGWEEWHNLIWRTEVNAELGDIVRHTGSNGYSFRGYVGLFPDKDATIAMFANSPSPHGYDHFSAVLALFLGNKKPLDSRAKNKIPEIE